MRIIKESMCLGMLVAIWSLPGAFWTMRFSLGLETVGSPTRLRDCDISWTIERYGEGSVPRPNWDHEDTQLPSSYNRYVGLFCSEHQWFECFWPAFQYHPTSSSGLHRKTRRQVEGLLMDELSSEILEASAAKTFFIDFIVCFGTMDEWSTVN